MLESTLKTAPALRLQYLPGYADFLLKNHLEDFARELLRVSREERLPILKYFEAYTDKELIELGKKSNTELLTAMISNTLNNYITKSVTEWVANNLLLIDREQIEAEDITLVSMVRRKAFRNFLKKYTADGNLFNNVMEDLDRFTAQSEAASFNAFINIQQEKIRQINQKLELKTELLEYKNIQLERINEELESFNYAASHDLQEPLRKIRTFSDRILIKNKNELPQSVAHDLEKIIASSAWMQNLINDLLNFSQSTTISEGFEEVDLNEMVAEIKNSFVNPTQEASVTITVKQLPKISAIPFQFEQVFINLLENAVKYQKEMVSPLIHIDSEIIKSDSLKVKGIGPGKTYVRISITDNGIGFEAEYAEKIFDLFKRLHGKDKYGGTGIGLALCKKIIHNHNGFITAESEINKGSVFNIFLPEERLIAI